jgi:NAD(P)-dependent dehydrogenase (short-subunit alcohol dehydrogenase family)
MKVVVVGAGGEIGSAICGCLAANGMRVIEGTHSNCDVTSLEQVRTFMNEAWNLGEPGLHGLVVAHGAPGIIKPTLKLKDEEFLRVLEVDLVGTLRVCREAKRYGQLSIVIVSSIHALVTYPERAAYAAAKAGLVGLARVMAVEWAKGGTRVNCVLPGQVDGTARSSLHPIDKLMDRTPTGSLVSASDVARVVEHLLRTDGINGQAIVVDGGYTASAWYGPHTR